jgi:hypothetical protein
MSAQRVSALMVRILLAASATEHGATMTTLVGTCGTSASVSRSVRLLASRGAVVLHRSNRLRRRARRLYVRRVQATAAGRELLNAKCPPPAGTPGGSAAL